MEASKNAELSHGVTTGLNHRRKQPGLLAGEAAKEQFPEINLIVCVAGRWHKQGWRVWHSAHLHTGGTSRTWGDAELLRHSQLVQR